MRLKALRRNRQEKEWGVKGGEVGKGGGGCSRV